MGTQSKGLARKNVNGPLIVRGSIGPDRLSEALNVLQEPDQHNRAARRRARALIRKQDRYLRTHVPPRQRNPVQQAVVKIARQLETL